MQSVFQVFENGDEVVDHRVVGDMAECRRVAAFWLGELRGDGISSPEIVNPGARWQSGGGAAPILRMEIRHTEPCPLGCGREVIPTYYQDIPTFECECEYA